MENKLRKAIVKATGKEVEVYALHYRKEKMWCNYSDMKIEYKDSELQFKD